MESVNDRLGQVECREEDDSDDNGDEFGDDGDNIDNNGEEIIENDEEKDITDNVKSELSQKYNLQYLKYQHKLYLDIFGINAIKSENIQQVKDKIADFEIND